MKKIINAVIAVVILVAAGYIIYAGMQKKTSDEAEKPSVSSFEQCVSSGYPVMESYPRKCRTPDGKIFSENIQNSPEIIPGTKSVSYNNEEFGFEAWYPEGSLIKNENFEGYLKATSNGTTAFAVFLSSDLFKGTNLSEAAIIVGVSPEENSVQKCGVLFDASEQAQGIALIGDSSFNVFTSIGAAAGNTYEFKIYRTVHNGSCYEIVELLHSGNIGNYPEGTVTEFDKAKFSGILENIAKTFGFDENSASGVMGIISLSPTCPVEKDPPDPNCAPSPYETTIFISKEGFSKTISSDFAGRFKVDLDPGIYEFQGDGGAAYPKCGAKNIEVKSDSFSYLAISCDSGIR